MLTGGCLCGAVRYWTAAAPELQGLCHCRSCQRLSGGGHVGFLCFPREAVTVEGGVKVYASTGGSGLPAERHFCSICCGALFGFSEVIPGKINIYAGSLDDPSRFAPQLAIFTASRAPWDRGSIGLPSFATLPPG